MGIETPLHIPTEDLEMASNMIVQVFKTETLSCAVSEVGRSSKRTP